jgi:hypothetical protein
VIVPSGTADGDSAVGAGPADGSTDGPPMTYVEPAGTPGGERQYRSGSPFEELVQAAWDAPCHHPSLAAWQNSQGLRQGGNTCPQQATGTLSWETWLTPLKRCFAEIILWQVGVGGIV